MSLSCVADTNSDQTLVAELSGKHQSKTNLSVDARTDEL